ncbi:MAG: hypothetical protein JRG71_00720 [Deltaproteobacteria bacterium]|nr:hypothetical protein [Deltaproteobacteria bacterium]
MRINSQQLDGWPKLAWVASVPLGSDTVTVLHGAMVEANDHWCVEAVWAGDFETGDFDKTDLVFGSGVRLREGKVVFVASGSSTDRIWHCCRKDTVFASNSLPALLAVAGLSLLDDHHYFRDIRTVCNGLSKYTRTIPVADGTVSVQYFNNLILEEGKLIEDEKADCAPHFGSYEDYQCFLQDTAEQLSQNMNHPERKNHVKPLTTVSSGYDSCATAVVAKYAGCTNAVTIKQSASYWRGSDSGEDVSKYLNLIPTVYNIKAKQYPWEEAVWAVSGRASILNWTQFDFPEPLCAFFTGCRGDTLWNLAENNSVDPFKVPSVSDMGIAEWRLSAGVFHVVVPFWGLRHVNELREISRSPEMKPWSVGGGYDRPIARRLVEESGVPRDAFAVLKKNSSSEEYFTWPHSSEANESFEQFLREKNIFVPPRWLVPILRNIIQFDRLFFLNVTSRYKLPDIGLRIKLRIRASWLLFHWGNEKLKDTYLAGLNSVENRGD